MGVVPLGQLLLLDSPANLRDGMGQLSTLPDELLLLVLGCCDATALARCGGACRGLRVFCAGEELWRARLLEELPKGAPLRYEGCWRLAATSTGEMEAAQAPCTSLV